MRFYSFERLESLSVEQLVEISDTLESNNYTGVLLPYGQYMGDYFVKVARAINKEQKLKYMIAIRPHTISAQYLSMIVDSISKISRNRIAINFVSGHIHDYEKEYGGLLQEPTDFSDKESRKDYMAKYIKEFYRITFGKVYKPETMISGMSDVVIDIANNYCDVAIIGYREYNKDRTIFNNVKKRKMIAICPLIRDSYEDIEEFKNTSTAHASDIVYGLEQDIVNILDQLSKEGITDILIHRVPDDKESHRLHDLVKSYKSFVK